MVSYRSQERRNIYLEKYKTAYFYIPKVASSSIKALCTEILELQVDREFHKVDFPSLPRTELLKDSEIFKFAFVRNPFDRLVSCYASKVVNRKDFAQDEKWNNVSFDQYVRMVCQLPTDRMDIHFRPQHTFIADSDGKLLVDFLGRLENIESDIRTVFERAGFPDSFILRRRFRSSRDQYRNYYSEQTSKLVEERFKTDLQLLDYRF